MAEFYLSKNVFGTLTIGVGDIEVELTIEQQAQALALMKRKKVVINKCFGGFGLSNAAIVRLAELGHPTAMHKIKYPESCMDDDLIARDDPRLVATVEELGESAAGDFAKLRVERVSCHGWSITEYDGMERLDD